MCEALLTAVIAQSQSAVSFFVASRPRAFSENIY